MDKLGALQDLTRTERDEGEVIGRTRRDEAFDYGDDRSGVTVVIPVSEIRPSGWGWEEFGKTYIRTSPGKDFLGFSTHCNSPHLDPRRVS